MNLIELSALAEKKVQEAPEFYKFSDLSNLLEHVQSGSSPQEIQARSYVDPDIHTFVFVDGNLVLSPEVPGLIVTKTHGLTLEVPKNTEIKTPVKIIHLIGKEEALAPVLNIKVGSLSKFTLVEEMKGVKESFAFFSETSVVQGAGSFFEHIQIDQGQSRSFEHASTKVEVEKDANYRNFIFSLQGKATRRNLSLRLKAPGAHGETYNLFLGSENEHVDINTVIHHESPDTTSNQLAKGILGGDSKGIFTGKIHIHPKAQRVVSGQLNKNLLLSKKAQVHSQPQLEIFADDVKCSHGSTTGQLSDEELFYFEARGIPEDKARTLLAHGFALEVVLKIQDPTLRMKISRLAHEALRDKFKLGGEA